MAQNFIELIRLQSTDEDNVFLSCSHPEEMGNTTKIAFGGCAIALALQAAYKTVEGRKGVADFAVYSLVGHFLGPTLTDRKVRLKVDTVRDTRSFATRYVTAYQTWDNGQERCCFTSLVDFSAPVDLATVEDRVPYAPYTSAPTRPVTPAEELEDWDEVIAARVKEGRLDAEGQAKSDANFGLFKKVGILRHPHTSLHRDNLLGFELSRPSPQASLPLQDRRAVDWFKCRNGLDDESLLRPPSSNANALAVSAASANACFLAFTMDMALSFLPLTFSGMSMTDASAVSTLDFALRFHTQRPRMNEWHLRELATITGQAEKTYSESRLWDEKLGMVATMTQTSVLRAKAYKAKRPDSGVKSRL